MAYARYDDAAAYYVAHFNSTDDPVSLALLSLLGTLTGQRILGVRYIHADIAQPDVLSAAAFDAAACSFGLSDIDDLDQAIAAVSAALCAGGRFVFSILHPCFAGGKDISGSWSPATSYYDEGRWVAEGACSTLRRQVGATHRTLSTYLNTLRAHDLWLDQIAEPLPVSGWDPAHDADRKPVHLVVRAIKRC
jgi:SAM-dependent methyltransferase